MNVSSLPVPLRASVAGFRRFTVDEYHRLTQQGLLTEDDNLELLEGLLVLKLARNPPHDGTIQLVEESLKRGLPPGWCVRIQSAVTLAESEPEPDLVVARGNTRAFLNQHPGPADVGLVIEVADSSLPSDRTDKVRIYARNRLPVYWIVNVTDRQVEVYEQPSGPTAAPDYGTRHTYHPGDAVPLSLDGQILASIPVADLLA
jgi:Uma2 family endonuclease